MAAQDPKAAPARPGDTERAPPPALQGARLIAAFVKTLPSSPGVYRMIGERDEVLYVGKANNLKKRVSSYTRPGGHANRIARMIANTRDMVFVTTASETEALLLEANLIKRLKPRYNVILRDDKSFPYILIATDHAAAQLIKHRGARTRKGHYFGPFASAGAVNRTLNALERAFLLRSCSDAVYESRTRPCLLHQIKRCAAPCTGEIAPADYQRLTDEARDFLSGRSKAVRGELMKMMEKASDNLDFERAAVYRDRLAALAHVQGQQGINPQSVTDADIFAIHQAAGQFCIQVFFVRAGQNWGNRAYFPRADKSLATAEVLASFLAQFYDDKPCPPLVLLSQQTQERELLAEALSARAGRKVAVTVPSRGEKRRLADHALTNAREALARHLAETGSQGRLLDHLAEAFALDAAPERIEIYDMSHISGSHALGAMVVAGPEGFIKNQYRKFNIKAEDLVPGDDYAMMREVLTRRFRRLQEEDGASPADRSRRPDLVIVDGGQGQINVAVEVMAELGLEDIALSAIAKGPQRDAGRERVFLPGREPFMLQPRDPVLYFLQRLRDEAHRFVIGAHRAKRSKALGVSPLDEIPGIGAARKRALLAHFGSAKALSRAPIADIRAVHGISARTAQIIYDFFHEQAE